MDETKKRDYKAEYKKFQSSTKAKKYRAELNKYNRKKGTYGNGDGKDASHKGGKIVGFEAQSKNRGRAEKSRLKKESNVVEGKLESLALNLLRNINREAGVKNYDHTKTADFNKVMKFLRKKMPKTPDRKLGDIAMSYNDYRKKQPKATIPDIDSVKDMEKTLKKLGLKESVNEGSIYYIVDIPKEDMKKYKRDFMGHFNKLKVQGVSGRNKIVFRDKSEFKKAEPLFKKLNVRYKVREGVNESAVGEHHQAITKFILTALSKAGIKILKVQMMKKSWLQGKNWYGGFFTVRSSNMVDIPGHGKVKRGSAVLPFYVDKKGNVNLQVSPKDYIIGKYPNMSTLVQNLKDFKKTDLDESINESAWTSAQEKAVKELDKKFNKVIGKKGIEPYSVDASRMWTSGGFRDEMKKIFGKNESINEREMSIKDAFQDLVKDHGSKKALDILTSVLTGGIGFEDPKKKKQFQQKLLKKMMKESKSVNETPYELGGMKVYSKADGLKKVKSMQKTDGAKIYKVTKTKTKLYGKHPVTMYNLHTKNKNHSTRQNPYGLDMMKGVYLIPVKESIKEFKNMSPGLKKALAQKGYGPLFFTIDQSKRQLKQMKYTKGEIEDTLFTMFGDQDPKIVKKIKESKIKESINEKKGAWFNSLFPKSKVQKAIEIAKEMGGNMTGATKKIEKFFPGMILNTDVQDALRKYNESINERMDKRQAAETLKQLGGNKFIMMTGAKNFGFGKDGLSFKIGRNAKAVNYVVIDLNGKDLYDIKFQKGTRVLKKVNDVYGDQLQKMFTKYTGMYTSLGTMGR